MEYNDFAYLWPPRPENKVPEGLLDSGIYGKWIAQIKKNGTCTVIFTNGREVYFKTRHGDDNNGDHKMWTPKPEHVKFFQGESFKWNVYVAELLHSKTPHIKDQLYIFDKIVHEGVQLVGSRFVDRQETLQNQWTGDDEPHFTRVDKNVVVAKNFVGGQRKLFASLENPEDEGLVLKNPKGVLSPCFRPHANDGWMIKVRKPHMNYGF